MRDRRAQDDALELAVVADVDGIAGEARDLVARFDAGATGSLPSKRPEQASATARNIPS